MKDSKGFTLIELLLSVSIISILGITATGFYSRFFLRNAVVNTVDQLVADFRKAQIYSMMGKYNGTNETWGVHYASNSLTLYLSDAAQANPWASRNTAFDETYTINSNIAIAGFTDVLFTRVTGLPVPASAQTITISNGSISETVTLNTQGVASK